VKRGGGEHQGLGKNEESKRTGRDGKNFHKPGISGCRDGRDWGEEMLEGLGKRDGRPLQKQQQKEVCNCQGDRVKTCGRKPV